MNNTYSIILVDDKKGVLVALQLLLKGHFAKVTALSSPDELPAELRRNAADVVLLDMNFTAGLFAGKEGLYWLQEIKRLKPGLPVVLCTAYADINIAVQGLKEGAADFVVKPWENDKLVRTLLQVAERGRQTVGKETGSTLEEMECLTIRRTLEYWNGNHSAVAVQLGISRQTLYNKMKKYGL